jgi:hypothetical protein
MGKENGVAETHDGRHSHRLGALREQHEERSGNPHPVEGVLNVPVARRVSLTLDGRAGRPVLGYRYCVVVDYMGAIVCMVGVVGILGIDEIPEVIGGRARNNVRVMMMMPRAERVDVIRLRVEMVVAVLAAGVMMKQQTRPRDGGHHGEDRQRHWTPCAQSPPGIGLTTWRSSKSRRLPSN